MMPMFDESRAILLDEPEPAACVVDVYTPLKAALEQGNISPHEHCLVAIHHDLVLVLPTIALVYHHVAQGTWNNQHWMVAYCCLCNGGAFYNAEHKGMVLQFAVQGFYDVMSLIADQQTQSYWNHLTGECVTGQLAGDTLIRWNSLLQMTAHQAHHAYPDALFTEIMLDDTAAETGAKWNQRYRLPDNPDYGGLIRTLGTEDKRLPRHDIGVGIWTQQTRRYYSVLQIFDKHGVIIDQVDGRTIVVCMDEVVGLPTVFYCETQTAVLHHGILHLDNNQIYKLGRLYQGDQPVKIERPNHNAIRWYSFSSLFPDCAIYDDK
ncbi:MAG: DUF3179 domain-containing protein [Anaerolineae bacterium]|nr:DUF3179 domain-containing protein [Anaerolineae bacterium]